MKSAFINDGYNRDGYIAESEFYPAVRFQYRPVTMTERAVIKEKIGKAALQHGAEAGEKILCAWMAERVKSWDLRDAGNHAVPIAAATMLKLEPNFSTRLHAILMGDAVSDPDPQTGQEPIDERAEGKN